MKPSGPLPPRRVHIAGRAPETLPQPQSNQDQQQPEEPLLQVESQPQSQPQPQPEPSRQVESQPQPPQLQSGSTANNQLSSVMNYVKEKLQPLEDKNAALKQQMSLLEGRLEKLEKKQTESPADKAERARDDNDLVCADNSPEEKEPDTIVNAATQTDEEDYDSETYAEAIFYYTKQLQRLEKGLWRTRSDKN